MSSNNLIILLVLVMTVAISEQKPSYCNNVQERQRRSDDGDVSGAPLTEEEFQQSLLLTFEVDESESPTNQGAQTEGLVEGDILDRYEEASEGEQAHNAVIAEDLLWKDGIVPYTISASFNKEERQVIARGMRHIQDKSCIQFVPRTTEADFVKIVNSNGGCFSSIGRIKGAQDLSLQRNRCVTVETTIHELMHALGFEHEHNRPDRDDYILINKDALIDGGMKNFQKYDTSKFRNFSAYDINSIMHYKEDAFAKDMKIPSIRPKKKKKTIGSIDGFLSPSDIMKLNTLYKCDLSLAVNVDCPVANLGSIDNVCTKLPKYGCYCIVKEMKTRTEANEFCQDHQMQLVWFETQQEIEEVNNLMIENNLPGFWTAGKKMESDTTWSWEQWITSASFPIKHFNWCPFGIPDNFDGEEYFIAAINEGSSNKGCWNDFPDEAKWTAICKPPLSTKIMMDNLIKLHSQLTVAFNEINDLKKKSIALLGEIAHLQSKRQEACKC